MGAAMGEIQRISIRHNEIMDYLMANPRVKLGDVARHFGITQPWLSQVIHSEAFQLLLKEKQDCAFHETVLSIREKINVAANLAMDKVIENLPNEPDLRTVQDVAADMLNRLGFGSKPIGSGPGSVNVQNNTFVTLNNTTRDEIAEARKLLEAQARPLGLGVTINGESTPIALPIESSSHEGETLPTAHLPFAPWSDPEGKTGNQI